MDNDRTKPKHCILCGELLASKFLDSRNRLVCPKCNWVHYSQLKVSAAAQITNDNKILLVKRSFEPWKDFWYLPAGYIEADESPREAVIREVREETRLKIDVKKLLDVYYFNDDPRGNGILIVYDCFIVGGNLSKTKEASELRYFSIEDLPVHIAGAGHYRALHKWKDCLLKND